MMNNIKSAMIMIGEAREEGRQPSYDGEYLSLYWLSGTAEWLLVDNGGVTASSSHDYVDACVANSDMDDEELAEAKSIQAEIDACINDPEQDGYQDATGMSSGAGEIALAWGWPVCEADGEWFVGEKPEEA